MSRQNFLITGANGDLAEAMAGLLRGQYPGAGIFGTDASGEWPGLVDFDEVAVIPRADAPEYTNALCEVAARYRASCVIPASDAELRRLAADPGNAADLPLMMNSAELIATFTDKLATAAWLLERGFPVPRTCLLSDAAPGDLPFIVKPRHGAGSRGVQLIRTSAMLYGVQQEYGDEWVAQEYLPGDDQEYTSAVVRLNGRVAVLIMNRQLDAGRTVHIRVVRHEGVESMLIRLAEASALNGSLNAQFRMVDGDARIFEINARFSSTVRMRHVLGFRDLVWCIEAKQGKDLPRFDVPAGASVVRLSREVILPFRSATQ